jgi:hypothetical protein
MHTHLPSTNALGLELIPGKPNTVSAAFRIFDEALFRKEVRFVVISEPFSAMNLSKFLGDTSSFSALTAQNA